MFSAQYQVYVRLKLSWRNNEIIKVVLVRRMVAWRSSGRTIYTGLSLLNNHLALAIITSSSPDLQYFSLLLTSLSVRLCLRYKLSSHFREKWTLNYEQSSPGRLFSGLLNTFWFYRLWQTSIWGWLCKENKINIEMFHEISLGGKLLSTTVSRFFGKAGLEQRLYWRDG